MSEFKPESEPVRVNDRRRFDPDGRPREDSPTVEAGEAADAEALSPAEQEVMQLRLDLEAARKRVDELARGYQGLQQDREEFKQRLSRERDRLLEVERGNVVTPLLEALDELELCLQSGGDASPLAKGVQLIRDKLLAQILALGVERLSTVGQMFNPKWAEAADMEVTADPDEDQRITAELRAGYKMKDRVLRPARVRVAKFIQPATA